MHELTLFEALLLTHFVVDWIFQWKWEAGNKSKKWFPLFFHCTVYTIVILDGRKFEVWLLENFKGVVKKDTSEFLWTMLLIGTDQIFHIIILALVVIFN